jgi:DNA-binding NarL/FixJ family response regulator
MHDSPTIVIADDHEIYRRGLKLFLENEGMRVIACAATGNQAVEAIKTHNPDILILDIAMPDLDGLGALAIVKHIAPSIRVVILTALDDAAYLSRARELGVDGYFSKGIDNDYLIKAIYEVIENNEKLYSTNHVPIPTLPKGFSLLFPKDRKSSSLGKDLTDKEALILSYLSMGLENQEISKRVSITGNTLKTHLGKIYTKLGVSDRTQAVIWALRNGF